MSVLGGIQKSVSNGVGYLTEPLKVAGNVVKTAVQTDVKLLGDLARLDGKAFVGHAADGFAEQIQNVADGGAHQVQHVAGSLEGNLETMGSAAKFVAEPLVTAGQIISNDVENAGNVTEDLLDGDLEGAVDHTAYTYNRNGHAVLDQWQRQADHLVG